MTTLEEDLREQKRHINGLRATAERRLDECRASAEALQSQGTAAAESGDTHGSAAIERKVQKVGALTRRYEDLIQELVEGGGRLASEVLLARIEGPDVDLLNSDVERNREILVQRATALLRSRDQHRKLRARSTDLNDKIRTLRSQLRLPPTAASSRVDFKINVTPATYPQKPDGPTFRDVADLLRSLGL